MTTVTRSAGALLPTSADSAGWRRVREVGVVVETGRWVREVGVVVERL